MNSLDLVFDTLPFARSHMKEPRGRGWWAFGFKNETLFAPEGTLTQAKAWVRAELLRRGEYGFHCVEVLS